MAIGGGDDDGDNEGLLIANGVDDGDDTKVLVKLAVMAMMTLTSMNFRSRSWVLGF